MTSSSITHHGPQSRYDERAQSYAKDTIRPVVDLPIAAPLLWARVPESMRAYLTVMTQETAGTQEFAQAGFPSGTAHGLGHIQSVFERANSLLTRSDNLQGSLNESEAFFAIGAILLHDIALLNGRSGHASKDRIRAVVAVLHLPLSGAAQDALVAIAAAHSGKGAIEDLPADRIKVFPSLPEVDFRKVAALVRLADEVAEDLSRTSPAKIATAVTASLPFHRFAEKAICHFKENANCIAIDINCDTHLLRELHVGSGRTLLSHFLDRCAKLEHERLYCSRFLPRTIAPSHTQLLIRDAFAEKPWCAITVIDNDIDLRRMVYEQRPDMLIPISSIDEKVEPESMIRAALQECFAPSLVSIVRFGSTTRDDQARDDDYLVLLDGLRSCSTRRLVRHVIEHLRKTHDRSVSLDVLAISEFWKLLALGDPFVVAVAHEGVCLIGSDLFFASKLIASQDLRFPRNPLVSRLLDITKHEMETLKTPATEFDQIQGTYRATVALAQVVLLLHQQSDPVGIQFVHSLSEIATLQARLASLGIDRDLVEFLSESIRNHKAAVPPKEVTSECGLSSERVFGLDMWRTFTNTLIEKYDE